MAYHKEKHDLPLSLPCYDSLGKSCLGSLIMSFLCDKRTPTWINVVYSNETGKSLKMKSLISFQAVSWVREEIHPDVTPKL